MKETNTSRLMILGAFLAVFLLAYLGVLYDTQVVRHDEYLSRSLHSLAREETIEASRGIITDRKGRPLVSNTPVYSLTFDTSLLKDEDDPNEAILRLLQLCASRELTWTDTLPISAEMPYTYTLDTMSSAQQSRFYTYLLSLKEAKALLGSYLAEHPELVTLSEAETSAENEETPPVSADKLAEQLPLSSFTAELLNEAGLTPVRLLTMMRQQLEVPTEFSMTESRMVLGVRYELALRKLVNYTDYVLVESIDTEFISLLTDGNYAGAEVISSSVREYETTYAAHVLGTVGRIGSKEEFDALGEGYSYDDWVGKSGVESAFEQYLKGSDGRRIVSTNSDGKITGEYYETEPQPGCTVELTIDLELQQAVEDALAKTITQMNAEDGQTDRGAGAVVEKVGTGEILALASYPTYDLSTYRQNITEISNDPAKPMQNRATQGAYAPGSTFKPLVAVAALEEGEVGLREELRDTGRWYYPDVLEGTEPWGYNCWKVGGHGRVNVSEAITESCNTFFYEMGYRLGIDRLSKWAAAFGLGESTGIEIGDRAGILASREQREENGGVWYGGDTVMAAIGQSDNLFTPLQLSNYICTLVSGGKRCETHLLKTVKTHNHAEIVTVADTSPVATVEFKESTLNAVKKGMLNLTTTGSLAYYFKDCVVSAGAKTGTAQLGGDKTNNGVFVCFAPYDDPEIAISIVIEKGGSGAALATAAVEILNAYFSEDEIGTMILPENQLLQ